MLEFRFYTLTPLSVSFESSLTYTPAVAWSLDDGKPCKAWIPGDYGWHVALYVRTLFVFIAREASDLILAMTLVMWEHFRIRRIRTTSDLLRRFTLIARERSITMS